MKMGGTNWRDFLAFFPTVHFFLDVQQKEVVAKQEKMLMWNCEFNLESLSESRQKDHNVSPIFTIGKFSIHIQSKNIPLGILCQKVHLGKNSSIFGTLIYDHIV